MMLADANGPVLEAIGATGVGETTATATVDATSVVPLSMPSATGFNWMWVFWLAVIILGIYLFGKLVSIYAGHNKVVHTRTKTKRTKV